MPSLPDPSAGLPVAALAALTLAVLAAVTLLAAAAHRVARGATAPAEDTDREQLQSELDDLHTQLTGGPASNLDLVRHPVTGQTHVRHARGTTPGAGAPVARPQRTTAPDDLDDETVPLIPDLPPGTNRIADVPDAAPLNPLERLEQAWTDLDAGPAQALAAAGGAHAGIAHLVAAAILGNTVDAHRHLHAALADPAIPAAAQQLRDQLTLEVVLPGHHATVSVPADDTGLALAVAATEPGTDTSRAIVEAHHLLNPTDLSLLLLADHTDDAPLPTLPRRRNDGWGLVYAHLTATRDPNRIGDLAAALATNTTTGPGIVVDADALHGELAYLTAEAAAATGDTDAVRTALEQARARLPHHPGVRRLTAQLRGH